MKKLIAIALSALMLLSAVGCSNNLGTASTGGGTPSNGTASTAGTATLKTGLGIVSSASKSADAGEKDGVAETDSIVAAVLVGADGKIAACSIDGIQTKVDFTTAGKITSDLATIVAGKDELGEAYGMKKASGIGKEWNEQAKSFAAYTVGKTVDEMKGLSVNEKGAPATGSELATSVTIGVGDFMKAVEKAVANAKELGAKTGDKLGLGNTTNIKNSTEPTADKEGLAQAYSTYAAASFGADGKVTSCVLDGSQTNVNFNASGKITSDVKAEQKSKNEAGDAYGMKKASSIGMEWYQEAESYAKYAVGKTPADLKGLAVNEKGAPTASDLTTSVTIGIGDFNAVIEKAAGNAH